MIIPTYPLASTRVSLPDVTIMVHDVPHKIGGYERHQNAEETLHCQSKRSLVVLNTS